MTRMTAVIRGEKDDRRAMTREKESEGEKKNRVGKGQRNRSREWNTKKDKQNHQNKRESKGSEKAHHLFRPAMPRTLTCPEIVTYTDWSVPCPGGSVHWSEVWPDG